MGLTIFKKIPSGQGELVRITNLPILVEPNEEFQQAKETLDRLVDSAASLANSITTDDAYNEGIALLQQVKRFKKDIGVGVDAPKRSLNHAKDVLMEYIHQLDEPAAKIEKALSMETGRYFQERERRRQEEEARLRREAELERQRKQREADLDALRLEIQTSDQEAKAAELRGQPGTATEIRRALTRFAALEAAPGAFPDPLGCATELRQAVALAQQHEQARIAAEKARAEGNKAAARRIEQAASKLEAPTVAQVMTERVQAAPVVVPKAELAKAKGQYTKETWKVKRIYDPDLVPVEFRPCCEHCVALLNDYAKRMAERASVPGVEFEKEVKTSGVRA